MIRTKCSLIQPNTEFRKATDFANRANDTIFAKGVNGASGKSVQQWFLLSAKLLQKQPLKTKYGMHSNRDPVNKTEKI